jgi:hypothetical protein
VETKTMTTTNPILAMREALERLLADMDAEVAVSKKLDRILDNKDAYAEAEIAAAKDEYINAVCDTAETIRQSRSALAAFDAISLTGDAELVEACAETHTRGQQKRWNELLGRTEADPCAGWSEYTEQGKEEVRSDIRAVLRVVEESFRGK